MVDNRSHPHSVLCIVQVIGIGAYR